MMYAEQGLLDENELGLDRANAADLDALGGAELQRLVVQNERCKAKAAAFDSKLMRAYDASGEWALEGALKPQGYLGTVLRVPSKTFNRQRSLATRLTDLPTVEAALAAGAISPSHRDKILAIDNPRVHDALVRDQAEITGWAKLKGWKDFEHALAEWLEREDPDGPEPTDSEHNRAHWSKTFGDRWRIDGDLDPISGAMWTAEADALERLEFEQDWAEAKQRLGRDPKKWELRRTDAQRRAAAMTAMSQYSQAGRAKGKKAGILISIFCGPDWFRKMAELDNGTVVRPGQLVPWLDDVSFETFLYDTELRNVTVSNVRTFRGAQKRFGMGRDRECVEKYCDEPVNRTQGDHDIAHSKDGPTATWNHNRRCGGHNRRKGNKDPTERDRGP